uniref:Inositol polyphosphate-related phosphatase domain-containing protein n=1 Tax=Biomphalaria glabrata TaxID=6526 RepID=A0A2C9LTQ2_BIOGL
MVVDAEPPDIYVVGFQELDLSKEAFIFTDSPKEVEWQKAVKAALHPKAKYLKVKSIRLVGIMLIVYIQAKHKGFIKFIDSDSVPTGIMGIMFYCTFLLSVRGVRSKYFSSHYTNFFQELDLSKEAFIFTDSPKEVEWQKAVKAALHPKAKYLKVKSIRLVGIMLIVYIQAKHKGFIKFIDSDSVPTGIMGIM